MKKQYNLSYHSWCKKTIKIYHDGELILTKTMWLDDIDKYIVQLEKDGYKYGYTQEEVNRARQDYEYKRANMISAEEV